jgi:hypothetical protein
MDFRSSALKFDKEVAQEEYPVLRDPVNNYPYHSRFEEKHGIIS